MLNRSSFTTLVVGVFIVYVVHTCWVMYGIVYTKPCESHSSNCIKPYLSKSPKLQVCMVYYSLNGLLSLPQLFCFCKF
ncbi:hypothetical protein FKM82_006845 [Ascaphus truei]